MCVPGALGSQKRVSDTLGLELQTVGSCHVCVLGAGSESSARAASALTG